MYRKPDQIIAVNLTYMTSLPRIQKTLIIFCFPNPMSVHEQEKHKMEAKVAQILLIRPGWIITEVSCLFHLYCFELVFCD